MPNETQRKRLETLATILKAPSPEEFAAALKLMAQYLKKTESDIYQRVERKLATLKNGKDGRDGRDGGTGPQGSAGKGADETAILERLSALIPPPIPGSPDSAEDIRNKLELLTGEERLDASAIKNLPELTKQEAERVIATSTALWNLMDVDVSGIAVGQSIRWDGARWIPFTPSGSNTSVFGESPADSGDQTTFTLAHTPVAGTVRLYRGGSYQQSGAGNDYTISGGTITLSSALQSGEILLADYEY